MDIKNNVSFKSLSTYYAKTNLHIFLLQTLFFLVYGDNHILIYTFQSKHPTFRSQSFFDNYS